MRTVLQHVLLLTLSFALSAPIGLVHAATAPLTITQTSASKVVGAWTLLLPDGSQVRSTDLGVHTFEEQFFSTAPGTYTLKVDPPSGARTLITVRQGPTILSSVSGLSTSFTLRAGEPLIVDVAYAFDGVIRVASTPTGVKVHVTGPGISLTGVTPVRFSDLPPYHYTVYYGSVAGCMTPRPQKRSLGDGTPLSFSAVFACKGATSSASSSQETSKDTSSNERSEHPLSEIALQHSISQSEIVPGGTFTVGIRIENLSRHDIRGLQVSEIVPKDVSVSDVIPQRGKREGNTITWSLPKLEPGAVWMVMLSANVADSTQTQTLDLTANAWGDGLPAATGKIARLHVLTTLPQTGTGTDILFLAGSMVASAGFLAPFIRGKR